MTPTFLVHVHMGLCNSIPMHKFRKYNRPIDPPQGRSLEIQMGGVPKAKIVWTKVGSLTEISREVGGGWGGG